MSYDPRIVAHRGWQDGYMENSLGGIRAAVENGVRAVEFDVRRTADNDWVVYHDEDLSRLHGADRVIAEHTYRQLCVTVRLPRLEDVLNVFHDQCLPMIEVKQPQLDGTDELCAIIDRFDFPRVVIARGPALPARLVERLPDVSVFLYSRSWEEARQRKREVAGFDLWGLGVTQDDVQNYIDELQEERRQVAIWTVNDPEHVRAWLDRGAAWVITDHPWLFAET